MGTRRILRRRPSYDLQAYTRAVKRIGGANLIDHWPFDDVSGTTARSGVETLGPDLFDPGKGTFDSGTGSWVAYGNNTIENDAGSLKITYVDTVNGAFLYLRDSTDLTTDLTVGQSYRIDFDAHVNIGASVPVTVYDGRTYSTLATITATSFVHTTKYFVPGLATGCFLYFPGLGAGEVIWLDNITLRAVLTGEPLTITGATLGQAGPPQLGRSLSFDGNNDVVTAPEKEDETGATWGPTVHGLSLVDGTAFLRVQGVDLSGFAGVEGSSTPFYVALHDSAGKTVWGYVGAADAAQALGDEKLTNGGFETAGAGGADTWANWTEDLGVGAGAISDEVSLVHGGGHAAKITGDTTSGYQPRVVQNVTVIPGTLYKLTFWTRGDGTNAGRYSMYDVTNAALIWAITSTAITGETYTQITRYFTAPSGCVTAQVQLECPHVNGGIAYFDDVSVKPVLHAGTDAVHIVSTRNGSTRNWAGIEAGFNYNDAAGYTFEIYSSRYQQTGAITVAMWVKIATGASAEALVYKSDPGFTAWSWYLYYNNSGGAATFVTYATSANAVCTTPNIADSAWHYIVATYDGATIQRIYLDGKPTGSCFQSGNLRTTPTQLTVGSRYSSGVLGLPFNGNISHFQLYDRSLTAAEVHELWTIGRRAHTG